MAGAYNNPNYQKEYQARYWREKVLADEERHQKLLRRRRDAYKHKILQQEQSKG